MGDQWKGADTMRKEGKDCSEKVKGDGRVRRSSGSVEWQGDRVTGEEEDSAWRRVTIYHSAVQLK